MKYYIVTFDTKVGGERSWEIHVTAPNAKMARVIASDLWYADHTAHMFHLSARLMKDTEEFLYHYFELMG